MFWTLPVVGEGMPTEALGVSTKPSAFALLAWVRVGNLRWLVSYIDARLYGLLRMHVLVVHHLASSWCGSEPNLAKGITS